MRVVVDRGLHARRALRRGRRADATADARCELRSIGGGGRRLGARRIECRRGRCHPRSAMRRGGRRLTRSRRPCAAGAVIAWLPTSRSAAEHVHGRLRAAGEASCSATRLPATPPPNVRSRAEQAAEQRLRAAATRDARREPRPVGGRPRLQDACIWRATSPPAAAGAHSAPTSSPLSSGLARAVGGRRARARTSPPPASRAALRSGCRPSRALRAGFGERHQLRRRAGFLAAAGEVVLGATGLARSYGRAAQQVTGRSCRARARARDEVGDRGVLLGVGSARTQSARGRHPFCGSRPSPPQRGGRAPSSTLSRKTTPATARAAAAARDEPSAHARTLERGASASRRPRELRRRRRRCRAPVGRAAAAKPRHGSGWLAVPLATPGRARAVYCSAAVTAAAAGAGGARSSCQLHHVREAAGPKPWLRETLHEAEAARRAGLRAEMGARPPGDGQLRTHGGYKQLPPDAKEMSDHAQLAEARLQQMRADAAAINTMRHSEHKRAREGIARRTSAKRRRRSRRRARSSANALADRRTIELPPRASEHEPRATREVRPTSTAASARAARADGGERTGYATRRPSSHDARGGARGRDGAAARKR